MEYPACNPSLIKDIDKLENVHHMATRREPSLKKWGSYIIMNKLMQMVIGFYKVVGFFEKYSLILKTHVY